MKKIFASRRALLTTITLVVMGLGIAQISAQITRSKRTPRTADRQDQSVPSAPDRPTRQPRSPVARDYPNPTPPPVPTPPPSATPDEFVGPFPSWTNVKTVYGARGDGSSDDTNALQQGLDALSSGGDIKTLFLPSGVYRITRTLRVHNAIYINVIGEDPDNTVIRWEGPTGGVMFTIDGVAYSRFARLNWDGQNRAGVAVDQSKADSNTPHFDTGNEYSEDVFQNVGYGIRAGNLDIGAAETSVVRSRFINNTKAGIYTCNYNALDWWIWFSYFEDCNVGLTNDPGAGNFNVYNSVFKRSRTADILIANVQAYSLRNNYSINSKKFYLSKGPGQNGAMTVIQGNTILDTKDAAAIEIYDFGPVSIYDNVIRSQEGANGPAIIFESYDPIDALTFGNTFTVNNPLRIDGRWINDGNQTVARSAINPQEPTIPFKYVSRNRQVFDVPRGASSDVIQQAINNAAGLCGQRPIVHLPSGEYIITRPLTVPANCDIQIVGDGGFTRLTWKGTSNGAVIKLLGPSRATLRDLRVYGDDEADGVLVENADQVNGRVYLQGPFANVATQHGILVNGLDRGRVDVRDLVHQGAAVSGVKVVGGPGAAGGQNLGGRTTMVAGASSSNTLCYEATQGARFTVKDFWYETAGGRPGHTKLVGNSFFTFEQGRVYTQGNSSVPPVDIQNFTGKATFIGLNIEDSIRVTGSSTGSVLGFGLMGHLPDYFFNNSGARAALVNSRWYDRTFGTRSVQNKGSFDVEFVKDMFAQTRSSYLSPEYEDIPAGTTDVRMYRVYAERAIVGFRIQR
jgi:hypothetical protein